MGLLRTLQFITTHPLTRQHKLAAVTRFTKWQFASRLAGGAVEVPFVGDSRLLLRRGMHGATGNIYTGLHEFEDMSFVLHTLRPTDLFVDVGANVGSYTVLAGKVAGARCISLEPVSATYAALVDNVSINQLTGRVRALRVVVAAKPGQLRMTTSFDAGNRVTDEIGASETVEAAKLDDIVGDATPTLVKIDVEGFESEVLAGATDTFTHRTPLAVVMETCSGVSVAANHSWLLARGFVAVNYEPRQRRLVHRSDFNPSGNTIYVRSLEHVDERVRTAPAFSVLDERL